MLRCHLFVINSKELVYCLQMQSSDKLGGKVGHYFFWRKVIEKQLGAEINRAKFKAKQPPDCVWMTFIFINRAKFKVKQPPDLV